MSIHPNPDSSQTDGVKVEPNGTFIAHAFIASLTASTALTGVASAKALGANQAVVCAVTAAASYRLDGVSPTATAGMQIPVGQSVALNMTDAAAALFISATGQLAVTYTM